MEEKFYTRSKFVVIALFAFLCLSGIFMRFYRITKMDFIFYDEGYYLNFNRHFFEILHANRPENFSDLWKVLWYWVRLSLATGKALWFLMVDSRVFFGSYHFWPFGRVLAAISGVLTMGVVYLFSARYTGSKKVGILSAILLALLPSHVFYSRIGMQETFSTLCFLLGFYFYLFPRKFSWKTFLAGLFFAGAWFTNYRLITLPVHLAFCEVLVSINEKRWPDIRKYTWSVLTFLFLIFMIGNLDHGNNTEIVFAWIFYQSNLAKEQFDLFNFLSFPYYLFRLENVLFGTLFFANIYLVIKRKWKLLLPFGLSCLHMFIYSFAGEKGARYLCVISPFLVMSVAILILDVVENNKKKAVKIVAIGLSMLMVGGFWVKSLKITRSRSDYETAMQFLLKKDENVKVMATQNYVLSLFLDDWKDAKPFPYKLRRFINLYAEGYRYLVVGPQAYVSWVKEMRRFDTELYDFVDFIINRAQPIAEFDHFNDILLERFVFDHNENLRRSLDFLERNDGGYGKLRIYDVGQILAYLDRAVGLKNIKLNPEYKANRPYEKYGR